jgi:hypothetical protein
MWSHDPEDIMHRASRVSHLKGVFSRAVVHEIVLRDAFIWDNDPALM